MPRDVTAQFKEDAFAQETGEVYVVLLQIEATGLPTPVLVTDNSEPVTYNGDTYLPFPFRILLPDDDEEKVPEVQLEIDNIGLDRRLVADLRGLALPPEVILRVARVTDPAAAEVEVETLPFTWRSVEYDANILRGSLKMDENFLDEAFPGIYFTPGDGFPAVL